MGKPKYLFDEKYNGPRWTYGLTYRPLCYANVPDGWIIFSDRRDPDFAFGTVDYPFELEERIVKSYQLTEVERDEESE